MVYDMDRPSKNMNLPQTQINAMIREQNEALYKAEEDTRIHQEAEYKRALEEGAHVTDYIDNRNKSIANRAEFLENAKTSFMAAAMFKLLKESMVHPTNKRDEVVMKNLCTKFVQEQGVDSLIRRFKYQNTLVAEMAHVVENAYEHVLEANDPTSTEDDTKSVKKQIEDYKRGGINDENLRKPLPGQPQGKPIDLKLDQESIDVFYKGLADLDTAEASQLIKDKVSDAMSEFIDQNIQNRTDYQEIIDNAKQHMADITTESMTEDIMNEAKRQINNIRHFRHKNVFQYVVEAVSKATFKDESLRSHYIHESTVDMDGIVHSAELIYTMLEMVNTTEMVDESYVKDYIISLTET